MARIRHFLDELRRRKVYVSAVAYAAVSIGIIELVAAVSQALLFPTWTSRLVTFLLILGFPVVLVLAWTFDLTDRGLRRTDPLPEQAQPRGPAIAAATPPGPAAAPLKPTQRALAGLDLPPEPVRRVRPATPASAEAAPPPDPERVRRAALSHVRHELRTPMNGIIGYAEMLLEDAEDAELAADLQRIREAGRRLLAMVDEILASGPGGTPADLDALADRIRADLRTPVSSVVGYAEMLIESSRENGREDLLPDLERILSSARRLLELSGDIVRLATHNEEDSALSGSKAITEQVLSKLRPVAADRAADGQGRLLVVDDNAVNRDLLARQLARHGYIVATAEDGARALELLAEHAFDLVLMDVIMPKVDGIEALRRMKEDDLLADVPVIMLSSLDEVDSAIRCIEMGADEYLSKPIQPTLLESRIAANLDVRRMRARERALRERLIAGEAFLDEVLRRCFPAGVAERVRGGGAPEVDFFPETTVLCAAFGRELAAPPGRPGEDGLVRLRAFAAAVEAAAARHGADLWVWGRRGFIAARSDGAGASGAAGMAALALDALREAPASGPVPPLALALHTGSAAGGLLGHDRLRYELWGEAVDTAEAMAARAAAGSILVSPTTHALLRDGYALESRGVADLGALGQVRTFLLRGLADPAAGVTG